MHKEMEIDAAAEAERIESFIRSELKGAGLSKIVIGLSGGVDSAAVAFLCGRAAGPENVCALFMPSRTSSAESVAHAQAVAEAAGIAFEKIEITAAVDALEEMLPAGGRVRRGNVMARVRMITIYDQSAKRGALVAGTGNRTEAMLGYTTLHGDSACGFRPIAHLYKCQVRQLAAYLGVPEEVVQKPPSAELWQGQTDEGELGFSYDEADWLLFNMLDKNKDDDALQAMGFGLGFIQRVKTLVDKSEFKRRMPHGLG
ncbi:MAG: NAD+ synthase [Planctomycetota bacterium]